MLSIDEELIVAAGGESMSLELLVRQLCESISSSGGGSEEKQNLLQRVDAVGVSLRCVAADVYRYGTVVRGPEDYPAEVRLAEIERELRELRITLQQNVPVHRAAANDVDFQTGAARGSVCNGLLARSFGMKP